MSRQGRKSADEYASLVVQHLVERGMTVPVAIELVQSREASVRRAHERGVHPFVATDQLLSRRGLSGGVAPKNVADAAGCALVPVEGFFFSDDLAEIPPLDSCPTSGLASGRAPKRNRKRGAAVHPLLKTHGRTAGAFNDEDMLYKISVAADEHVEGKALSVATKRIFGKPLTAQDFEVVFSGAVPEASQKAKLTSARISKPKYGTPETLKLMFTLDTGTLTPGKMIRVYYKDPNGITHAYHSIYDIDGKTDLKTGKGLGTLITKNTLLFYKSLNLGSIDTHTEWVGRYVWAAFGFQWSPDEADQKAQELAAYLEPRVRRHQLALKGHAGSFHFDLLDRANPWKAFKELLDARAITGQSWKTAGLHLENPIGQMEHVGKPFLAGVHVPGDFKKYVPGHEGAQGWTGTLVLSDRHPTWQIAKARLGL